ncbi:MAG: Mur ligase family protein [Chloroflexota bacterium]|nr:Mur ligase family protein [Chloroflexota bacterium]MDP9470400.1 Mur ligase family protein [Chloroflexota bacterium]
MELVEIRDLDGPNIFLLDPAIKVELSWSDQDIGPEALADLARRSASLAPHLESGSGLDGLGHLWREIVAALHRQAGGEVPETVWRQLETAGRVVVAYGWQRRAFALEVAKVLAGLATGGELDPLTTHRLQSLLAQPATEQDQPAFLPDSARTVPIIAITGTNGKTTTTRLIVHILREAGRRVGWSSSAGVFIEGDQVLDGDYTGPTGALRVLRDAHVDVAVLETARGGILLRGLAYESNDVGVFTNVSPDHLDLHGIRTVEGLARAKATVLRVTRPDGYTVLNADDPLVVALNGTLRARSFLISRRHDNPHVAAHQEEGGATLVVADGALALTMEGIETRIVALSDIPMTFGGRAGHMVENALCGAAACLGLGLSAGDVASGLASFRNSPQQNTGRLNVYNIDGVTVIVDYAHNEAGLKNLLEFGRGYLGEGGRLVSIIGTAGDRTDDALRALGAMAANASDRVIIKRTTKYLRGRSAAEMDRLFQEGIKAGNGKTAPVEPSEQDALRSALTDTRRGDVITMMCIEQVAEVQRDLSAQGAPLS